MFNFEWVGCESIFCFCFFFLCRWDRNHRENWYDIMASGHKCASARAIEMEIHAWILIHCRMALVVSDMSFSLECDFWLMWRWLCRHWLCFRWLFDSKRIPVNNSMRARLFDDASNTSMEICHRFQGKWMSSYLDKVTARCRCVSLKLSTRRTNEISAMWCLCNAK